ncbi:hypothetical protein COV93_05475 [Candidatus Woesearchaeota archaeon CG11_big_fil_rev_8_21_14_0_20_43_8]|nr:MAG: hypothetical protein COV93_05475 [Candidatus Woesearchaeota archaeon CG11_big_fil_rev_8_21_14_0_20_43_8]
MVSDNDISRHVRDALRQTHGIEKNTRWIHISKIMTDIALVIVFLFCLLWFLDVTPTNIMNNELEEGEHFYAFSQCNIGNQFSCLDHKIFENMTIITLKYLDVPGIIDVVAFHSEGMSCTDEINRAVSLGDTLIIETKCFNSRHPIDSFKLQYSVKNSGLQHYVDGNLANYFDTTTLLRTLKKIFSAFIG